MTAPLRLPRTSATRLALLILPAAAALVLATATSARAYVIEGQRWPGPTITYYATAYKKAANQAAQTWNNANVGITFRKASSSASADFVVIYSSDINRCEGLSLVGYQYGSQSWTEVGAGCDRAFMVFTLTHELGHILGLGHETHRCARMNPTVDFPTGTPGDCRYHRRSYWFKHLLKNDDIRGVRALYGG